MLFNHESGILLHPTSLPGPYGIGDLGPRAFRWLDFLAEGGLGWWQVLPLGPTGYGDSPYQSFSAFAGNPMLISPEGLLQLGLLTQDDLDDRPDFPDEKVDFGALNSWKADLFLKAVRALKDFSDLQAEFTAFRRKEAGWLEDYALYRAIKSEHGEVAWGDWPADLRDRRPAALQAARGRLAESIEDYAFQQFIFFRQWDALRNRMRELSIRVIGDIPIYVAMDSVDVWANRRFFHLDRQGRPIEVAGVPPDYFSETGQLWGNPLYRWSVHAEQGYAWWLARFRAVLKLVDVVRLDHFRGIAGYWAVPAGEKTAVKGAWIKGPGEHFLNAVWRALGDIPLIAEDLGEITPDVFELRDQFNLPGMKILQFAFDDGVEHQFLPHNYPENCVAYTGTHDNDTTIGWYLTAPEEETAFCREYLNTDGAHIAWNMIHALWASRASLSVAPFQDFLELGTEARMNYPSIPEGNWDWRMAPEALSAPLAERIAALNRENKRSHGLAIPKEQSSRD